MEITTIVHTHGKPDVTFDTVDSIKAYMTNQILLLVDGAGWHNFDKNSSVSMLKGFHHGYYRAPYRNIILGLMSAAQHWPDSDWYCYLEYDCLIGSSVFKKDLAAADKSNVWLIGNDFREKEELKVGFPLLEVMLKTKFEEIVYLLGAALFYNKKFIKKCIEENFFERFLYYTNEFKQGFFPGYQGPAAWDLIEHMMPTLAQHWGGKVAQFAKWSQKSKTWVGGNYRRYPIRWQPDLFLVEHEYLQASVMHPLKEYKHPVREFHRNKRQLKKRWHDAELGESNSESGGQRETEGSIETGQNRGGEGAFPGVGYLSDPPRQN